jgi:predicted RNA-binding protein associated with RNAse of E/G family
MRKKYIEKRTKFIANTYMKEAIDYDIVTIKEDNLFITIKKYKKMSDKFTLLNEDGKEVTYIDEGYYVVELTPIGEKYNIRYYFDNNKKFIDYYIDIILENGIKYMMPYYVDLYLDIIHYPKKGEVTFCDEDELEESLNNKIISKKDYDMAYKVGNKLIEEIKNKTNKYMNIDVLKYINKWKV